MATRKNAAQKTPKGGKNEEGESALALALEALRKETEMLSQQINAKGEKDKGVEKDKKDKEKKRARKRERNSSSSSSESSDSSDSDDYEDDISALKPLIPQQWVLKKEAFRNSMEAFKRDVKRADPKRPTWRAEELDKQCATFMAMHDDVRRRRKAYEGKDLKEPQSKAAAKVFQILATAFCSARGASDTNLKATFGRLKRKDRRNSRKLLGAVSRVLKVKQTQSFRANTVKRTPIFPKNGGTGNALNTLEELMEKKSGRKVAKQRYQYFLGYLKKEGKELKKEKLATQVKAYIARQMKSGYAPTTVRTHLGHLLGELQRATDEKMQSVQLKELSRFLEAQIRDVGYQRQRLSVGRVSTRWQRRLERRIIRE
jgi:hypothetical protein